MPSSRGRHSSALISRVDRLRARRDGRFEDAELLLYAAVETSVILMPAAGGEQRAIGMALQELADRRDAVLGVRQIVQTKFEKAFARLVLRAGVVQKLVHGREPEGDTDFWKWRPLRH